MRRGRRSYVLETLRSRRLCEGNLPMLGKSGVYFSNAWNFPVEIFQPLEKVEEGRVNGRKFSRVDFDRAFGRLGISEVPVAGADRNAVTRRGGRAVRP